MIKKDTAARISQVHSEFLNIKRMKSFNTNRIHSIKVNHYGATGYDYLYDVPREAFEKMLDVYEDELKEEMKILKLKASKELKES